MLLDEEREAELLELVQRLDRLVPKDGARLTMAADGTGRALAGNRLGYLRFAIAFLQAALQPLPQTEDAPPRIEPRLGSVFTETAAGTPFEMCELDESIVSRPPVRSGLGVLGQLGGGVAAVFAILLLLIGASVVWRWIFG
jgi:hypothetical protein